MMTQDERVELAKLTEQAERYADMVAVMKEVPKSDSELTIEERNLLAVAYKNEIGAQRSSWRVMLSIEQKVEGSERKRQMAKQYRGKIESEVKNTCHELLTLLDKYLIPKATTNESKVFYLKMKGDYYRYLAEVATDAERQKMAEESQRAYKNGFDLARGQMLVTDPILLGLVLNFAVFHYEILDEPGAACRLAKQALDDALAALDSVDEYSYRDSTLIMQLLRDNLAFWTSDEPDIDNANQHEEQQ